MASRRVHHALRNLAPWGSVAASTARELEATLEHLEAVADMATGVHLAQDPVTPQMLRAVEEYLRRM